MSLFNELLKKLNEKLCENILAIKNGQNAKQNLSKQDSASIKTLSN